MASKPLPHPVWSPTIAKQLAERGAVPVGQRLEYKPRRFYAVTYSDGTTLAYLDSPSKVTGATEDKPGLTWWAAGLAADYLLDNAQAIMVDCLADPTYDMANVPADIRERWYKEARKQHDTRKNDAAKLGNEVHNYIELCGRALFAGRAMPIRPAGISDQVAAGIDAFESWWQDQRLTVVAAEIPCCHPGLGFAGTIDAMAIDEDGHGVLIDWKTSRSLRASYTRQVGAYTLAWSSTHPDEPIVDAYIVRLGKDGDDAGKFETFHMPSSYLDDAEKAFVESLNLYRFTEDAERRIKDNAHRS